MVSLNWNYIARNTGIYFYFSCFEVEFLKQIKYFMFLGCTRRCDDWRIQKQRQLEHVKPQHELEHVKPQHQPTAKIKFSFKKNQPKYIFNNL